METIRSNGMQTSFAKVNGVLVPLEHYVSEKPGNCRVFGWVLAVACMFLVGYFYFCILPK